MAVVNLLDHGVCLLARTARIVYANRSARRLAIESAHLEIQGGMLVPTHPLRRPVWQRLLAEFEGSGAQLFEFAAAEAGGSCLGQLRLVPSDVAGDELISLSLGAPLSAREMRLAEFATLHRLTPAESRVMIALVDDLSPAQVAQRLNISPGTVRSHIRRIFDKTGVGSQRGLAVRVGALPLMSLPPR
jgi:DNA-binding CsgD family transcriptional regulator